MATAQTGRTDLDAYRREADRFMAAIDEEHYLHFAGLKDELELVAIYERFADLVDLDACTGLGEAAAGGPRGVGELWRFACEGYLGNLTRTAAEELARLEATASVQIGEESIGYRMLRPTIANEPDRDRRKRLEEARRELTTDELNPVHRRIAMLRREGAHELGGTSYRGLYERFGFGLEGLAAQCRSFLTETEDLYVDALDALLERRLGLGLKEAEGWDMPRLFRAPEWDDTFPADAMLPALERTLADLGIDLRGQRNVELDLEQRPRKSPRAFCVPIEVPQRIVLVIQPMGGPEDWHALFHEAGHTEHYAHTSSALPVEDRRLGDFAVTEGWAMLLEHLVNDPLWLRRRLDFARPEAFTTEAAVTLLYIVRRYAGKLLYELELHADEQLDEMPTRYVEWLEEATKLRLSPADFLADVDPGFYSTCYLRAWAFEAQLSLFLRESYGSAWFTRQEAGSLLRELWNEGSRSKADEILKDVTGAEIELAIVADRVKEAMRA